MCFSHLFLSPCLMHKTCTHSVDCSSTHPTSHFCSVCIRSRWCQLFRNHSWLRLWRWGSRHVPCRTIRPNTHGNLNGSRKKIWLHQNYPVIINNHVLPATDGTSFNANKTQQNKQKPETGSESSGDLYESFGFLFCWSFLCGETRGLQFILELQSDSGQNSSDKKSGPPGQLAEGKHSWRSWFCSVRASGWIQSLCQSNNSDITHPRRC